MACACGGKRKSPQTYIHTAPDGSKTAYSTEVEALAARASEGGTVRPQSA